MKMLSLLTFSIVLVGCTPSLDKVKAASDISAAIKSKEKKHSFRFRTIEANGNSPGLVRAICENEKNKCKIFPLPENQMSGAVLPGLYELGHVRLSETPVARGNFGPSELLFYKMEFSEDLKKVLESREVGGKDSVDNLSEGYVYKFKSGEFGDISIITQTTPSDFLGRKIIRVSFAVPYTYNSVASKVLNTSSKNYKGQATFVLYESGWTLSDYRME